MNTFMLCVIIKFQILRASQSSFILWASPEPVLRVLSQFWSSPFPWSQRWLCTAVNNHQRSSRRTYILISKKKHIWSGTCAVVERDVTMYAHKSPIWPRILNLSKWQLWYQSATRPSATVHVHPNRSTITVLPSLLALCILSWLHKSLATY